MMNYDIKIKEDSNPLKPEFEIRKGFLIKKKAPVQFFEVTNLLDKEFMWGVSSPGIYIDTIIYGETPEGFTEYEKPKQLELNQIYRVFILIGHYGPDLSFKIIERNGTVSIETLRAN